ncbi:uncharacterized protein JCM6883_006707 [Sporobolomyces salmoneus]|uniref:uncharacterized protein n=1 Tax=Sporobolomyces salmoneus TaxID=183962 RepID=UPI0031714729
MPPKATSSSRITAAASNPPAADATASTSKAKKKKAPDFILPPSSRNDLPDYTKAEDTRGFEQGGIFKSTPGRMNSNITIYLPQKGMDPAEGRKAVDLEYEKLVAGRKGAIDLLRIVGHQPSLHSTVLSSPLLDQTWTLTQYSTVHSFNKSFNVKSLAKGDSIRYRIQEQDKSIQYLPMLLLHQDESVRPEGNYKRAGDKPKSLFAIRPPAALSDQQNYNANFVLNLYKDEGTGQLAGARFALLTNASIAKLHDRTENHVFVIDFPRLETPPQDFQDNATLTDFSIKLYTVLNHLVGSNEAVASFYDDLKYFNFTESRNWQLLSSIAGEYNLGKAVRQLDEGLPGLARALRHLQFGSTGTITMEYLVGFDLRLSQIIADPLSFFKTSNCEPVSRKFLQDLWIAVHGVDPLNGEKGKLEELRSVYKSGDIKILYPRQRGKVITSTTSTAKFVGLASNFEPKGTKSLAKLPSSDARSEFVRSGASFGSSEVSPLVFDAELKSARPNHTNMFVIKHEDRTSKPPVFEAVVGIGTHSPTPSSFGELTSTSFKIKNTELSVLHKITASNSADLRALIKDAIPYKSKITPYTKKDVPSASLDVQPNLPAKPATNRSGQAEHGDGGDEAGEDEEEDANPAIEGKKNDKKKANQGTKKGASKASPPQRPRQTTLALGPVLKNSETNSDANEKVKGKGKEKRDRDEDSHDDESTASKKKKLVEGLDTIEEAAESKEEVRENDAEMAKLEFGGEEEEMSDEYADPELDAAIAASLFDQKMGQ